MREGPTAAHVRSLCLCAPYRHHAVQVLHAIVATLGASQRVLKSQLHQGVVHSQRLHEALSNSVPQAIEANAK